MCVFVCVCYVCSSVMCVYGCVSRVAIFVCMLLIMPCGHIKVPIIRLEPNE
jgi:hypothetical protein